MIAELVQHQPQQVQGIGLLGVGLQDPAVATALAEWRRRQSDAVAIEPVDEGA